MNNETLDKAAESENALQKKLSDTQTIPRVDDTQILPRQTNMPRASVRELEPIRTKQDKQSGPVSKQKEKRKRIIFLTAGFLIALLCGFVLAGYYHDRQQLAEDQRIQQAAQLDQQAKDIKRQNQLLMEQKAQLEKEKRALEEKQQSLQAQSARMAGKNEQIQQDQQSGSTVSKIWDKVTGKEKERQQSIDANQAEGAQAGQEAASLSKSIDDAQTMINDVDSKLNDLAKIKQEADGMKQAAASVYNEHADTIDTILHYASEGMGMVRGLLTK